MSGTVFDHGDGTFTLNVGNLDGTSLSDELLNAGAVGQSFSKRITATVNTTLTITPPAGTWRYLKVSNLTADTWVSVGINESPVAAPSADPGVAADWEVGYDIIGGQSELIPLSPAREPRRTGRRLASGSSRLAVPPLRRVVAERSGAAVVDGLPCGQESCVG